MRIRFDVTRKLALMAIAPSLAISLLASAASAHQPTPPASVDPSKPVPRGYITVNAIPEKGGAKLVVETFQDRLQSPVTLSLAVAIATPNAVAGQRAGTIAIPLKVLSRGISDPTSYYQKQEFFIDYDEMQRLFAAKAPNATNLIIEPGVAMVVKADFPSGHDWGGFDRGGVFFLPAPLDSQGRIVTSKSKSKATILPAARPTALDLAFTIPTTMTNIFNDRATKAGLKVGGQVRSRVEGEGKFQITKTEYLRIKRALIALSKDPSKAAEILGTDWTIKFEERYLKKGADGKVLKGADGLPIPDPMVDTYYDNKNYDAAKKDMAIRYRWTEQNQTGSWNFKPGIGRREDSGIVYRVEYGVDTTDDKASSLTAFADSFHPLNPFQTIRTQVAGAKPSDFLIPAVRIEDNRYKFKLVNKDNLAIEISVDDVRAFDLRQGKAPVRYFQLEMDIDHLSTASNNVVSGTSNGGLGIEFVTDAEKARAAAAPPGSYYANARRESYKRWSDAPELQAATDAFLAALDSSAAFDGRPVLHDASDIEKTGQILTARAVDFQRSSDIISKVRDYVLPDGFRQGAQKYAFAAAALDVVNGDAVSDSVKVNPRVLNQAKKTGPAGMICSNLFGGK